MQSNTNKLVWVVFTGKTDIAWLKFLKKGFRHCFALIKTKNQWMSFDPLSAFTDIEIYDHLNSDFDLPEWLEKQGYKSFLFKLIIVMKSQPPSCLLHVWKP